MSGGLTGSSNLTPEQQSFYTSKFGVRYVAVQQTPYTMTRAQRRKLRFKPRSER